LDFHGAVMDITERKEVQEKLRRSQEHLAGYRIGHGCDYHHRRPGQRIVLFQQRGRKMFLFREDALDNTDRFILSGFRASTTQHVQGFWRNALTRRSMEHWVLSMGCAADGEEFPIEASISQIESDGRSSTRYPAAIHRAQARGTRPKGTGRILDLAPC